MAATTDARVISEANAGVATRRSRSRNRFMKRLFCRSRKHLGSGGRLIDQIRVFEERRREIALAGVGKDDHDALAGAELFRDLDRGPADRAGRDADEDPFLFRQPPRRGLRVAPTSRRRRGRRRSRRRSPGSSPAPMPCSLCGLCVPPLSTCDSTGSTATMSVFGFSFLNTCPTPVTVPPVPTPATIASTLPPVSRMISCAVVSRWIFVLAGLSNCFDSHAPLLFAAYSSATRCASLMPFGPGVRISSAPRACEQLAALDRHRVGHDQRALVAFGRGDERQADAGVAAGRFDDGVARLDLAGLLRFVHHRDGDAVLDRRERVERLEFGDDFRRAFGDDAIEPHQRRTPDQLRDVVVDLPVHVSS